MPLKNTAVCEAYINFLGLSAFAYPSVYDKTYMDDICVYALSANRQAADVNPITACNRVITTKLNDLSWRTYTAFGDFTFAKSNSAEFMCYKFKQHSVTTDSETEPEAPYSYEEFLNQPVLQHVDKSTSMQYSYIWSAYSNAEITGAHRVEIEKLLNNSFYRSTNLNSIVNFDRADYYRLFVPETDIIHDTSILQLDDDAAATTDNACYDSFNTLLYCINPKFDKKYENVNDLPAGFNTNEVIPISVCSFTEDIVLAGKYIQFEPNLNGIVSVK